MGRIRATAPRSHGDALGRRGPRRPRLGGTADAHLGRRVGGRCAGAGAADDPAAFDFDWSIGDRYGLDADGDGIVDNPDGINDLATDKTWIQNPTYALTFDTLRVAGRGRPRRRPHAYTLTLSGPESKTVDGSSCKVSTTVTKLGTYTAKVDMKAGGATLATARRPSRRGTSCSSRSATRSRPVRATPTGSSPASCSLPSGRTSSATAPVWPGRPRRPCAWSAATRTAPSPSSTSPAPAPRSPRASSATTRAGGLAEGDPVSSPSSTRSATSSAPARSTR